MGLIRALGSLGIPAALRLGLLRFGPTVAREQTTFPGQRVIRVPSDPASPQGDRNLGGGAARIVMVEGYGLSCSQNAGRVLGEARSGRREGAPIYLPEMACHRLSDIRSVITR